MDISLFNNSDEEFQNTGNVKNRNSKENSYLYALKTKTKPYETV